MGEQPLDNNSLRVVGGADETGFGRIWSHDNLFIADASLHPTNGAFNPVLTIMALAFRSADHILSTLGASAE